MEKITSKENPYLGLHYFSGRPYKEGDDVYITQIIYYDDLSHTHEEYPEWISFHEDEIGSVYKIHGFYKDLGLHNFLLEMKNRNKFLISSKNREKEIAANVLIYGSVMPRSLTDKGRDFLGITFSWIEKTSNNKDFYIENHWNTKDNPFIGCQFFSGRPYQIGDEVFLYDLVVTEKQNNMINHIIEKDIFYHAHMPISFHKDEIGSVYNIHKIIKSGYTHYRLGMKDDDMCLNSFSHRDNEISMVINTGKMNFFIRKTRDFVKSQYLKHQTASNKDYYIKDHTI